MRCKSRDREKDTQGSTGSSEETRGQPCVRGRRKGGDNDVGSEVAIRG